MYSLIYPEELSKEYCDSVYKEYGLFRTIHNPAVKFNTEAQSALTLDTVCTICNKKGISKLCTSTRKERVVVPICFTCHFDLDMYGINPGSVDYCRQIRSNFIETVKQKSMPFKLLISVDTEKYVIN